MKKLEHLHLTVNAVVGSNLKELKKEEAKAFLNELLVISDMKPLGDMQWAEAEDLDFPGQSFVQMITTSHCSLHFFSETNEIYFDLYSCKAFEYERVVNLLEKTFQIKSWTGIMYSRAIGEAPVVKKVGSEPVTAKAV
ncbi:S-adenosylmethionine decarboxylase [Candidatus Micrarchaeota archaeon]|nr:S-adenosylmethionine decarboxylase [Candidatus Micrarchaeota archaeon]